MAYVGKLGELGGMASPENTSAIGVAPCAEARLLLWQLKRIEDY